MHSPCGQQPAKTAEDTVKKGDVRIGGIYDAKIGQGTRQVFVLQQSISPKEFWCYNLSTGHRVMRTAAALHEPRFDSAVFEEAMAEVGPPPQRMEAPTPRYVDHNGIPTPTGLRAMFAAIDQRKDAR